MKKILLVLLAFVAIAFGENLQNGKKAYLDGIAEAEFGSEKKAFELFRESADKNYPEGKFMLGLFYFEGVGVDKDYKKGVHLMEKALDLDKGVKGVKAVLGYAYYRGKGVEVDKIKAYKFLIEAAKEKGPNLANVQSNLDSLCKESPWACK